jgi:hypothetical protein
VRIALFVVVAVVVLTLAELMSGGFSEFTRDHALISTFMTEAVLLVGVYLVIDEIVERRHTRRWSEVTELGIRALSTLAHRPAEIVRSVFDQVVAPALPEDDEELVERYGDALGDWLRADETRARRFADETRRSATSLEEAIIRWGPTLVEDSHSAGLLNVLPDVVDSTRSAAQAISPAPRWVDAPTETDASVSNGWDEDARQRFKDSVLEILEKVGEFDRKCSA